MKKEYKEMQDFIDDVHAQLSIKEMIIDMGIVTKEDFHGDFISCMFHDGDNTPSLQVTENFWKCYGCGAKGDLFAFIMQYYNTDFVNAVKKLADFLNINISSIQWKFDSKYNKMKEEWNTYLEAMQEAPKEIQALKRDYFPQEIGYDPKLNYIVLALTSKTGSILGFTKRRVNDSIEFDDNGEKRPKWKHSSLKNSLIAQCHNVFNLYTASPEIRKKKFVIVTEGPKDVIAYQRIGLNNSICVCGTSNSSNIWEMILPVKEIVLSMDLDKAGIEATIKTLLFLSPIFDIQNIFSVILPEGSDPYDVITNESQEKLKEYFENKIPAVEFLIKYGTVDDVRDLYNSTADYNKVYVLKSVCKVKGFSLKETESWLFNTLGSLNNSKDNKLSEKDKLLAIVNCEDINVPLIPIEKAKRILKLKYGIDV